MADATITAAGMRVVRLLVGHPPRTVGELIRETGVTRTAVTEQLNELVAAGFVERSIERLPGRGRPRHRFSATQAALVLLFANNQQLVVPAIWKAVDEVGGEDLTKKLLRSVSRILAAHYKERITASDPKKRIDQFRAILEEEGGLVDVSSRDGHVTVTKRTCAFISMFDEQRHVCSIDLAVMSEIAGCPVQLTSCRHDGDPCCKVEIDTRAVNRSGAASYVRAPRIIACGLD
jgi:predicted ArsR family transcriptional regulator